jgi:hypothetical protein
MTMSKGGVVDYANAGYITQGEADAEAEASVTPKPRAGESTKAGITTETGCIGGNQMMTPSEVERLIAERDLLRERERELVAALEDVVEAIEMKADLGKRRERTVSPRMEYTITQARELLAKLQEG